MKSKLLALSCTVLSFSTSFGQSKDTTFKAQWKEIDSLIYKASLPKTAETKIDAIYQQATARKIQSQVIKAIWYKVLQRSGLTEKGARASLDLLQKEIDKTTSPVALSVLKVMQAKEYNKYYQQNRWNLGNRTNTTEKSGADFTAWTENDFRNTISKLYNQALANESILKHTSSNVYGSILTDTFNLRNRPTMYDVIVRENIDYYKQALGYYNRTITDSVTLGTTPVFLAKTFSLDNESQTAIAKLLQQLLAFHEKDADKNIFALTDIDRLSWFYQSVSFENKEMAYRASLQYLAEQHSNTAAADMAWYLIASRMVNDGTSKYDPLGDTTHRYDLVKAKQLLEEKIAKAKDSDGKRNMQELLRSIHEENLQTQIEKVNVPNKPFRLSLQYKNVDTLFIRIFKIPTVLKAEEDYDAIANKKILKQAPYKTYYQILPQTGDYQNHRVELKVDALPAGSYVLAGSNGNKFDSTNFIVRQNFSVSAISYIQNNKDYFVLNRESGQPLKKVKVKGKQSTWNADKNKYTYSDLFTDETDDKGYFRVNNYTNGRDVILGFIMPGDTLQLQQVQYYYTTEKNTAKSEYQDIYFYTDRGIYRPAQTVYFKGIIVVRDRNNIADPALYKSKDSVTVLLQNANRIQIDSIRCAVNEFGAISGKFKLPANTMTGSFSLSTKTAYNSAFFSVEEYKRPTYSVSFDTLSKPYKLNDSITVTGKLMSYAQAAVNGADLKYTVTRNTRYPYPWLFRNAYVPYSRSEQVAAGTARSNADGTFSISFKAIPDNAADKKNDPVFNYSIQLTATDANGETREGSMTVRAAYKAFELEMNVPASIEARDFKQIAVTTQNMAGKKVPAQVTISVYPLEMPATYVRTRLWQRPDLYILDKANYKQLFPHDEYDNESDEKTWLRKPAVVQKTINTANTDSAALDKQPDAGYYIITASAKDESGVEIRDERLVKVYNTNSPLLDIPAYSWNDNSSRQITDKDSANVTIGSSAPDVFVITKFSNSDKYEFHTLNNSKKTISRKIQQKDKGIDLLYAFVKDNRLYQQSMSFSRSLKEKALDITYHTFRNKTLPGAKETWSVNIKNNKGEKANAELLTAMYDASLDQITGMEWRTPYIWNYPGAYAYWNAGDNFSAGYGAVEYNPNLQFFNFSHDINSEVVVAGYAAPAPHPNMKRTVAQTGAVAEGMVAGSASTVRLRGTSSLDGAAPLYVVDGELRTDANVSPDDIASTSVLTGAQAVALYGSRASNGVIVITTKGGGKNAPQTIRKNFNETAFFFPAVHADTAGNYTISFTMPEALTQWKWMSLAHTKDLAFGYNQTLVVTQKELMAQLNLPRFLRNGDKIELSAKISNTGSKEYTGQAHIQLINPETNQPLDGLFQNVFPDQYFTVAAGQSSVVKFPVSVPYNFTQPVIVRVTAASGDMNDGEEYTLPILSNRILVTESLPFLVKGDTTAHFTFTKLANTQSETLKTQNLTVEYTPNPVWSAIQALPYLSEYPYECAEQTFNRFYANALASYIVKKSPALKAVFDQWQKDTTALQSPLEQNPELKQILLQETPWVLAAGNETQQRKNIAMLFDIAKMSGNLKSTIDKLKAMQLPSGGFPWFKDGREDRYITQYILTGIARLTRLNAIPADQASDLQDISTKALQYADKEMNGEYDRLIKNKADLKSNNLSSFQVQYLYMRSYFSNPVQVKTAYNYYYQQAMQYWQSQSSYMKAMIAFALLNTNQETFALSRVIPSIEENAIETKDKGMYWKDAQYGYYWYDAPIEQQALLIELAKAAAAKQAGNKFGNKAQDMLTWLILQKQTNNWKTTKATADACYALLLDNKLSAQNRTATIQLGSYTVAGATGKQTAGNGYFKTTIGGEKVQPSMGNVTVTTTGGANNSISYGAVYWQYFEDIDKVTPSSSPLSVKKRLFIEDNTGKEKVLKPVAENQELKAGDKITVRLELRSDRDMEYIHLKDMRAASMEPVNVLSSYKWQDGLGYYEATKDASTNFFFSNIRKGTYVFDYSLYVTHTGTFSSGIATVQCMYAPEFTSNSESIKVNVK